jgi:hypothetical protein
MSLDVLTYMNIVAARSTCRLRANINNRIATCGRCTRHNGVEQRERAVVSTEHRQERTAGEKGWRYMYVCARRVRPPVKMGNGFPHAQCHALPRDRDWGHPTRAGRKAQPTKVCAGLQTVGERAREAGTPHLLAAATMRRGD